MYRSILVPLDGSPWSEQAVPMAATIAQRAHATVHLVHVHLPQLVNIPSAMSILDTPTDGQQREQEQSYLTGVASRLRNDGIEVRTSVRDGATPAALLAYAAQHAVDLVVMTMHGRTGLPQLWFGSVADQLVRSLPTPVLLLHPTADAPTGLVPHAIRHVLIPLDGSKLSEECIEHTLGLGELMEARYTLLHVVEQQSSAGRSEFYSGALSEQALAAAKHGAASYLDEIAAGLCERTPHMHIAVATGQPSEMISAYAKQHGVDLIAMSTHGRSGLARWYFGSVTTSMLRTSPTPLLVSKPQDWHKQEHPTDRQGEA